MPKKKILIVDDEADVLEFLEKRLTRCDYDIITANDGARCLELASQENPDLILLDIVLPVSSGYEVLRSLKNNELTRFIPVVMHSVKKESNSIFDSLDLGVVDYIIKPANFTDLLDVVKRYI